MHPKQSWPSAFVDTAIIASVVILCFVPSVSPMAWNVLGQIALVRFGVAVTKQAFGGGGGSGGDPSSPASGPKDGQGRKRQDTPPSDTLRRSLLMFAFPAIVVALGAFGAINAIVRLH